MTVRRQGDCRYDCSAGSLPSPYFAMLVAEHYESAAIAQLGDGSGGYRREVLAAMPEEAWGTLDELRHLPEFIGGDD